MSDDFSLSLELHHTAAHSRAERTEGDEREAALVLADSLTAALSTVQAEGFSGLGAKARALQRQAPGGRLAALIEQGGVGIAERLLAASLLADVARLLPAARTPLARLAGAGSRPLDERGNSGQDSELRG